MPLVLSRKKREAVKIADEITVTVIEIRGDKVRLLIDAPRDVPVHREEIYEAIKATEAADTQSPGLCTEAREADGSRST